MKDIIRYIFLIFSLLSLPSHAQTPLEIIGSYKVKPDMTSPSDKSVGGVPVSFDVLQTGAATFSIPIECPKGVNGMQPNISIGYSSQSGEGFAGWGCSIQGVSVITRGMRTVYHDGAASGRDYSGNDALYLDGKRLVQKYGNGIVNGATNGLINGAVLGSACGFVSDFAIALMQGALIEEACNACLDGAAIGGLSGAAFGIGSGFKSARENKVSPWTGEKINMHHSFAKFLGGDPKQEQTPMSRGRHIRYHGEFNEYLLNQTDDYGNNMRPVRGNSGKVIRAHFDFDVRMGVTRQFYDMHPYRYWDARLDFYRNNGLIWQWRPW